MDSNSLEAISAHLPKFLIFQDLAKDPASLTLLAERMTRETFEPRQLLIDEAELDSRMFFLLEGQVEIQKMDESGNIVVIGKSDARSYPFFGESVLFGSFKRSANVVAHSRCSCLSLKAADFEAFMSAHPSIAASVFRGIARTLFERLSKADRDIFFAGLALKR